MNAATHATAQPYINSSDPQISPQRLEAVGQGDQKLYDLNFCLPVKELENERVRLTPFIPSLHASLYTDATRTHPGLYRYFPWGPFPDLSSTQNFFEVSVRQVAHLVVWAVIDKTRPDPAHPELGGGSLAGTIGLLNTSPEHLMTEIGHILIFPSFQRTHVATNAIGLLLNYCFDAPTSTTPGLGMRRVQWQAHAENAASIRTAERMGLKLEGIIRWQRVLRQDKEGLVRDNDGTKPGRHSALLAVCWDDWECGVKDHVNRLIVRTV
ncbi:hypothetical protein BOTBODRAFT_101699 [Botryobasidium botryosum FD-172 SS1]|uniref:N-acetyltransferase domain-containing protein n=1 Tax=Botryobasidium botryosum (strain FD-172 SS1) TaxID=930990 RepID=A0A067N7Z1_BOTB1|nr:hypothetical protein BOTBODRAFT_101699 [Botryobasidium botryosum FD-172 SS1]